MSSSGSDDPYYRDERYAKYQGGSSPKADPSGMLGGSSGGSGGGNPTKC